MARTQYVVRVAGPAGQIDTALLDSLRYAGLITVHFNNAERQVWDMRRPHGLVSQVWANQNAQRMRTFGFNAVPAKSTDPVEGGN